LKTEATTAVLPLDTQKINRQKIIGAVLVLLGAIGFSSKSVFGKLMYAEGVDMISVVTLRMLFALPFFLIALLFSGKKTAAPKQRHWISLLILGFVGHYLSVILNFSGLQYVSAGIERIILFVYPTLVVIISAFVFKRNITQVQLMALAITYAGILIVFWDNLQSAVAKNFLLGAGLIFGTAITYSSFLVGSEKLIPRFGSTRFTAYSLLISSFFIFVHYAFVHEWAQLTHFSSYVYLLAFGMAVIATVAPSFLLSAGIKRLGAGNASIMGSVGPISTIFLSYSILNESVSYLQGIGTLIVLGGVMLITWKERKKEEIQV
jgi:drug/metabolite transporter (DMT)-like permease